ncbi:MMPL family transporter [Iamia majanohamensis]|uniref:MMPL family transporter n=1 Tax=Iamia majanohamensis TaxID=467976 RepID=A0AAF0BT27_9ACTN|nr:MMPL family transporter [Iamia majanohamensis]WCO66232.1 MMPL family transporter [Iamia majanohamensis]
MSKILYRLGHWSVRRRRWVLAAWLTLLLAVGALSGAFGGATSDAFSIPGTESQEAVDLLEERFPEASGSSARLVFASTDDTPLSDPGLQAQVEDTLDEVADAPEVVTVSDPFATGTVSPEGLVAFAEVGYATPANEVPEEAAAALEEVASARTSPALQVELGGEVGPHEEPGHTSELIGLAVAVVVLLISFGSLVAMGLPLASALIGVGVGLSGVTLVAGFTDLSSTAPILATMIGLAVGIDYALFIVTRHRQDLAEGHTVEEAAARANATAGGAVVFAGMTVVIALAGLAVVGIPFLTVMGLAAAVTVLIAVAIAVTLLPALLGFAGRNIDRWRIGRARTGSAAESHHTLSARWARRVVARPGLALAGGLAFMAVLALPMLSMRLGMPDAGSQPPDTTARQAYDLLAEGFGPGFNGPLTMVVDLTDAADPDAATAQLSAAVAEDPGVQLVTPAQPNAAGDTAIVGVIPTTAPSSAETSELVHHLRDDVLPDVEGATGAEASVAGPTALLIDVSDKLSEALPVFMGLVIGLTMVLLLVVFRSLLVPVKAAIAILLSIGASFGVLVAIFQWGWLQALVGLQEPVPIISFLPILMFAVLFGLSMDYEVFILSRIREDYVRTGQARASVISGLTSSARVITAAALIMISVFASFALDVDPTVKMMGIGFSVAVLLDATVVRMVIVPATMALFGDRAWALPGWLDRVLPDLDVEGEHLIEALDEDGGDGSDGAVGGPPAGDRELVGTR